jgi:hypothetical protein
MISMHESILLLFGEGYLSSLAFFTYQPVDTLPNVRITILSMVILIVHNVAVNLTLDP